MGLSRPAWGSPQLSKLPTSRGFSAKPAPLGYDSAAERGLPIPPPVASLSKIEFIRVYSVSLEHGPQDHINQARCEVCLSWSRKVLSYCT